MKVLSSNLLVAVFCLLTLALIMAGVGYSFDALPLKYVIVFGILWEIDLFITIFWEDTWKH